ncbi:MAG: ImmA/IrrE family metallo-endopeptidase, partial [Sphingobium sp.]
MAVLLGISVSYLSQLENDDRPLTAKVKAALARAFPLDWSSFDERQEEQLLGAFNWAMASPAVGSPPADPERTERLLLHYPDFAARYVELHHAWRQAQDRIAMMEEALASDAAPAARMPWELVRDWFHEAGNYIHALDCRAEDLAEELDLVGPDVESRLIAALHGRHGCTTEMTDSAGDLQRAYDPQARHLRINAAQPPQTRAFLLAVQLMRLEGGDMLRDLVAGAQTGDMGTDALLHIGLANYGAGALLMPYRRFRDTARALRHDIDPLARAFGVSFEQACHRLSTLQRPGAR